MNWLELQDLEANWKIRLQMVRVAATQMRCQQDKATNMAAAERLVREAVAKGAQLVLLQELFSDLYFCQVMPQWN